ncbi:hypothetical protein HPB52_008211 [Rhipicephalus sanguineus]|uniref:Lactate/malate dehydrogenase C-terminal domain-containing protein n=1 Tax=Rhipicephalus sanguineus TaxID=34632 RepID=A0A9D4SU70_RHISA|nr:hypothetical protein HPB52_008211 [Rhipicephalus sanguineus]
MRGRRSSSVSTEHQREFERPRRRADRRPDELNSEEEPFVKPGTMRPKPPPPQIAKATAGDALKEPIRVLVTAGDDELAYRMLIPLVRGGRVRRGPAMVLHLSCSPEEDEVAFLNVDFAFLNDSCPLMGIGPVREGVQTYAGHGKALSAHAKKTVKVIITGHPDQHNTTSASETGRHPNKIVNMIVWGHRGDMLLPDYRRSVVIKKAKRYKISDLVSHDYLDEGLPEDVKIRDDLVQKLTKHPGILSRAKAACDQMRDWWIGLPAGQFVTMSVLSDGVYGVPPDLVFSYPVFIDNARSWKVVQGIALDEKLRHCISESAKDLERERDEAMEICTELAL